MIISVKNDDLLQVLPRPKLLLLCQQLQAELPAAVPPAPAPALRAEEQAILAELAATGAVTTESQRPARPYNASPLRISYYLTVFFVTISPKAGVFWVNLADKRGYLM